MYSFSNFEPVCCPMSGLSLLLDLHIGFSGGRSWGLVFPSVEEFSAVYGNGYLIQYSCLENPHGQRSLADYSPQGCKESDTTEWLSAQKATKPMEFLAISRPGETYLEWRQSELKCHDHEGEYSGVRLVLRSFLLWVICQICKAAGQEVNRLSGRSLKGRVMFWVVIWCQREPTSE